MQNKGKTVSDNVTIGADGAKQFKRFDIHQRIQHWLMLAGFITLVITGWPLKMAGVGGSQDLVNFFGSLEATGTIHRIAAVVMIVSCLYHLIYIGFLFQQKRLRFDIVPNLQDARDLRDNLAFFVGLRKEPPRFGRWTYFEKFDYWAVFWGIFIMVGSGFILWFPEAMMSFLPSWVLSVAHIAHSDEALLAALAIFIWHFYNVHLRRHVFPMNWVWLTGKLTEEQMKHEHPAEYERLLDEIDDGDKPSVSPQSDKGKPDKGKSDKGKDDE